MTNDQLDAYLVRTHSGRTVAAQAERLGVSFWQVSNRRRHLGLDPSKRYYRRKWSMDEEERAADLIAAGLSPTEVSRVMRRSWDAIVCRISIRAARGGIERVHRAEAIARLFGVSGTRVFTWIRIGWLDARRGGDKHRSRFLITDQAIIAFLHNRATWVDWSVGDITEPFWMDLAVHARLKADGYWMRVGEVAEVLHYHRTVVLVKIRNGDIPATRHGRAWFVWSEDLEAYHVTRKS